MRLTSRKVYGAARLRFVEGGLLDATGVFTISLVSNVLSLSHPARTANVVSQITLACATAAKNSLRVECDTLTAALCLLEWACHEAMAAPSKRDRCLNVALGGGPTFGKYGLFIPCGEQAQRMPFPCGSFAATPCSCDIENYDTYPKDVRDAIEKMYGKKTGHNYCGSN